MKKRIICIFTLCLSLMITMLNIGTVYANENPDVEVRYLSAYIEEYIVTDHNEIHRIIINRDTYVLTIDGEDYYPIIQELAMPMTTMDYSSAVNLTYNIPWRGTAAVISTLLSVCPGIGYNIAAAIVAYVAAEGAPLYITFTQYKSVEDYYSTYYNIYYKKAINMNLRAYKNSISSNNFIYGPVNGSWFDPVRPY